jgi:hypothetical protein
MATLETAITAGQRVRFHYRERDWSWLRYTYGPLGPYLPPEGLANADGEIGVVTEVDIFVNDRLRRAVDDHVFVSVRMERPLGWSMVEEYDDEQLKASGWTYEQWPTEFPAPLSALEIVS